MVATGRLPSISFLTRESENEAHRWKNGYPVGFGCRFRYANDMRRLLSRIPRYWLFQIGGWSILLLANFFFLMGLERLLVLDAERMTLSALLGLLFSHLMRACIIRFGLLELPIRSLIPSFLVLTLVVAVLGGITEEILRGLLGLHFRQDIQISFMGHALRRVFSAFPAFFIWNLIYYLYHVIEVTRSREMDRLRLQHEVKELELRTLKSHINPHFIFNALNGIRSLIEDHPEQAREAVTMMSRILRSSLQLNTAKTVPLAREMEIVSDYLALERMRFEDRLQVHFEIQPETLGLPVPPMMLQMLVENGIKHGISHRKTGGRIEVHSRIDAEGHTLVVRNTGVYAKRNKGVGFGIQSTTHRLAILFGNNARFEIGDAMGSMVEARVHIPMHSPSLTGEEGPAKPAK
jgi:two-component system LytT family sensor kinase